jgi:trypsin-like peptidase
MNKLIATLALLAVNAYAGYNPHTPELVAKTKPGVVLIEAFDDNEKPQGEGTGWLAKAGQYYEVVTNAHVAKACRVIILTTLEGKRLIFDKWDGYDEIHDIALARVKDDGSLASLSLPLFSPASLPEGAVELKNDPREGDHILVIGNPEGLTGTVSDGMISAIREGEWIQISAPISSGSSGSPVLNDRGQVVAMVKGFKVKGQNLNICVPYWYIELALRDASQDKPYVVFSDGSRPKVTSTPNSPQTGAAAAKQLVFDYIEATQKNQPFDLSPYFTLQLSDWYGRKNMTIDAAQADLIENMRAHPNQAVAYYPDSLIVKRISEWMDLEAYFVAVKIDWTADTKGKTGFNWTPSASPLEVWAIVVKTTDGYGYRISAISNHKYINTGKH